MKAEGCFGKLLLGAVGVTLALTGLVALDEWILPTLNLAMLSKGRVVDQAQRYIAERTDGHQQACLYVVRCDGDGARLRLISDLDRWNIADTRRTVWRRATSDRCPGRTTNIGMELIPEPGRTPEIEALSLARYRFSMGRFVPRNGRFQSGSFSDEAWERCTPAKAVIRPNPPPPRRGAAGR